VAVPTAIRVTVLTAPVAMQRGGPGLCHESDGSASSAGQTGRRATSTSEQTGAFILAKHITCTESQHGRVAPNYQ
jgi:hypothetical protein